MPSSDQSSGAGSGNVSVPEITDSVIPGLVKSLEQVKSLLSQTQPGNNDRNSGNNGNDRNSGEYMTETVEKFKEDLIYIGEAFKKVKAFESTASALLKDAISSFEDSASALLKDRNVSSRAKQLSTKLRKIKKLILDLKLQIPLPHDQSTESDAHRYRWDGSKLDDLQVVDKLPDLHVDNGFGNSSAFRDFRLVYESLDLRTKMCLLCFAVIPENENVRKRFMTYWWVGEGFVSPGRRTTYEEAADEIFRELEKKDCIEPVNGKRKFVVDSYKMNPFIRSAVIVLAKEAGFFDFDDKGNPSAKWKSSYRVCLVYRFSPELKKLLKSGSESADTEKSGSESADTEKSGAGLVPEKVQTIFNVNEPYPDFFIKLELFSKFKNVKVLYLGKWQTSPKHHVEVDSVEFLKGLKSMKLLRFFSLQGILGIIELPDSVCKLLNLRILDIRGCQNLEALPEGIGSLTKLTHLDMSECYVLDYMPKGIASLSELQVLKRFIITDNQKSCPLADLLRLKKLRKLSIYTNTKAFPNKDEEIILQQFENLEKLTIEWRAFPTNTGSDTEQDKGEAQPMKSPKQRGDEKRRDNCVAKKIAKATKSPKKSEDKKKQGENGGGNKNQDKGEAEPMAGSTMNPENRPAPKDPEAFKKLKKLVLKDYPSMEEPSWLLPGKLPKLEKLYIREGNLQYLSPGQENEKWKVNILRLKSLSNLKMDWKKLLSSFPDLIYLEKCECPQLTFFPCNENGIVLKPRTEDGKRAAARYNIVH